jgi:hypothetical protein
MRPIEEGIVRSDDDFLRTDPEFVLFGGIFAAELSHVPA